MLQKDWERLWDDVVEGREQFDVLSKVKSLEFNVTITLNPRGLEWKTLATFSAFPNHVGKFTKIFSFLKIPDLIDCSFSGKMSVNFLLRFLIEILSSVSTAMFLLLFHGKIIALSGINGSTLKNELFLYLLEIWTKVT